MTEKDEQVPPSGVRDVQQEAKNRTAGLREVFQQNCTTSPEKARENAVKGVDVPRRSR